METDDCKLYKELCKSQKIPLEERVSAAITFSSSTGELNLAGLSLTTQTCEIISRLLSKSKVILKLDFSDCLLPPQGLAALLNTVPTLKLHSLQLKGNNISASSTIILARMITRSNHIKMLGLEWNNLGICHEALEQFCNALSKNSCLEVLDLRNNHFDAESALLLGNALRKNVTLRVLDIRWNCIEQEGAQCLLSALQVNKTLTSLKVTGNSVPNDLTIALENATKHNLSLFKVRSECDARTQLLAKHVRVISEQRAQELKLWADKSQQNLRETEGRLQELETMLATKQNRIEILEAEKTAAEANKVRLKELEVQLKEKENQCIEARKETEEHVDALKKMKVDQEADIARLHSTMTYERDRETQRADEAEKQLKQLTQEVTNLKDILQATRIRQNDNLEAEHKSFKEQLERSEKNFESRLSDTVDEARRTEQAMKVKITQLETTVATLERNKSELNAQLLSERTKWTEEKSVLLNEAKEKEVYKLSLLNEKLEHMKEDKTSLEGQLTIANTTIAQLHRENATMLSELGEVSRKLSHLQEDISAERLVMQRLRLEKNEDLRSLENTKNECEKLRNEISLIERRISEMNLVHEKSISNEKIENEKILRKLESKEKEISAIRTEEAERVGLLFTAFNRYFGGLPKT